MITAKIELKILFSNTLTKVSINVQKQPPEAFCKKKVFLEISQNSQENTCARVSETGVFL